MPRGRKVHHADSFTKDQIKGCMDLEGEAIFVYEHTPHPVEFQI